VTLTMVCNTHNYYLVSVLCTSSGILNTTERSVSEGESGPMIEDSFFKGPNRVGVSLPSPEDSKRSSFRNVVLSSIYNSGRWTKSRNQVVILRLYGGVTQRRHLKKI
jgi:hypothetical protein